VWDDWNIQHVSKHAVTVYEIEQVVKDKNAVYLSAKLGRRMLLGRFKKRMLAVVLNEDEKSDRFYAVTARDMDRNERAIYRQGGKND